jgi:hypothetical protein
VDLLVKSNYRDPNSRSRRWCKQTRRRRRRRRYSRYSRRWLEMGGVRSDVHNIYIKNTNGRRWWWRWWRRWCGSYFCWLHFVGFRLMYNLNVVC